MKMRGYSMFLLAIIAASLCLIESTPINRGLKSYVESLTDKNEDYGYPDMKDVKMPDLKGFKLPDVKEYEMPKDFKMPEMENYTIDSMPEMENYTSISMPDIDYSSLEKLREISIFKKMENITKEEIFERLKSPATFPKKWIKAFDEMTNMLTNKSSIYYQVLKDFNMTNAMNAMEKYVGKMAMSCSFCQSLTLYVAVEVKVSKRPIDKIKNVVDSVCSIYPKGYTKDACDLMVKDLKLVVEYINKGVAQNDICLNIKLCDKETIQTMESEKLLTNSDDENIDENIDESYDDKDENDNDRELINKDRNEWKEIEDEQTKEKQAEAEDQEYVKEAEEFLKEEEKEEDRELKEYEGVTDEELEGGSQIDEKSEGDSQTDEESSENDMYVNGKTGKYYVNILKEKFKNIWGKGDPIRR